MRSLRNRASLALLALAAVAVAASVWALYVERNIFDSAGFANHAEQALERSAVRSVAADRLTDVVVDEIAPDAVAVRPLLEATADSMLGSAAFGRVFRTSALQLHRAAVKGDVDGAVLTLANVGILISTGLRRLDPSLAEDIPEQLDARLLQVASGEGLGSFTRAAHLLDRLRTLLLIGSALLIALAFAVSPYRRRTIGQLGYALLGSGTLVAVGWFAARGWALSTSGAASAGVVDAANELWDVFMGGLLNQALLLAGLGVVLVAATDGALGGVRLGDRLRGIWRVLSNPPMNPWLRILWSVGALAIGGFVVLNPALAAQLAAIVAGLLVLSAGMQELTIMASPQSPAGEAEGTGGARIERSLVFGLVGAAAIVLLASSYFRFSEQNPLQVLGISTQTNNCNGSERLCERPLNTVTLPMTHNSMSATAYPNFLFAAQNETIAQQLDNGIRGLAIDVYFGFPGARVFTDTDRTSPQARSVMKKEFGEEFVGAADRIRRQLSRPAGVQSELFLCHGFCELGAIRLADTLADVERFLKANPREVMVIVFEDYVPAADLAAALEKSGVAKHAYKGPWQRPMPTLEEMVSKDQRVLLLTENAAPDVDWMHNAYDVAQETPFRVTTISELDPPKSCREQRGEPSNPLFLINHWVDTPPNPRPSIARRVNAKEFVLRRARACQDIRGLTANMISVDFAGVGDLMGAVDVLNGVE